MQNPDKNLTAINHIDIVMVGTTHPGNIGAAARAMNNMCFKNMILVDPQCPVGDIAYARSSGAHSILDARKTTNTLPEAIKDAHLVIGMTARQRALPWPELDPHEVSLMIAEKAEGSRVAVVFGREQSGLTNEELALCNYMVRIPTNPEFSSLNVASAVQVMCYEIYRTMSLSDAKTPVAIHEVAATSEELEGFFSHLQQVLLATKFLDPGNPGLLMPRLRRLFQRAEMEKTEVNILRGILGAVQKYKQ